MSNFTKKPVTIQAVLWTGKNLREVIKFTDGRDPETKHDFAAMKWDEYEELVERDGLKIFTLEGKMNADVGDWIIRGVKGEFYPCKPDIFAMTYDAEQPAPTAVPAAVSEGERDMSRLRKNIGNAEYIEAYFQNVWGIVDELSAALKAQPAEQQVNETAVRQIALEDAALAVGAVGVDWNAAGDEAKSDAAVYLVNVIRGLKAQPVPTEAQGESPFKFWPWSKEAEMVEGWTAAEKAREAAQGEDSARLGAGCDCDSPEWCKNYNRCHRQVCGFELRGATPKPV